MPGQPSPEARENYVSGNASKTCVPYTKSMFGKYRFGDMVAALEEPKVFGTG